MKYKDLIEFIIKSNRDINIINKTFGEIYTPNEINFCFLNIDKLSAQIHIFEKFDQNHTNNSDTNSKKEISQNLDNISSKLTEEKKELKTKRTYQKEFRQAIINKYKKCIVSGANYERCEASHIVPFSEDNVNRYNTDNGILLRADLHKLFDKYLVSINPTTNTFVINKKYLSKDPSLANYNNIKINNNYTTATLEFLDQHYQLFIKYS